MKNIRIMMAVSMVLIYGQAQASPVWWDACDGDWFECDNWIPDCPGSSDTVYIDEGCGGPLINSGNAFADIIYVGFDMPGNTLTQGVNGALTVSELYLGEAEGSEGMFTLSGNAALSAGWVVVGHYGSGTFVQNGGTNTITGSGAPGAYLVVGNYPTSTGTYQMTAGDIPVLAHVLLGYQGGTGTYLQSGGTVTAVELSVRGRGSTYELSGTGTLHTTSTSRIYGLYGETGLVNTFILSGGTHNVDGQLVVESRDECAAAYTLTDDGTLSVGLDLYVAYIYGNAASPPATFTQSGGTNAVTGGVYIGGKYQGIYALSGGTHTVGGSLVVGLGSGRDNTTESRYDLSGTGQLTADNEYLGQQAYGTIIQTAGTNSVTGDLRIGYMGCCWSDPFGWDHSPGVGRYELGGTGQLSVQGEEMLGSDYGSYPCSDSRGDFIQSGGTHTVQTFLYIGYHPGLAGTYEISDGELSAFKAWVGYEGVGEFTQSGGVVTFDDLDVGRLGGASGTYELSGAGVLTVEDRVTVGRSGDGVLILGGGTLMTEELLVGRYSGAGQLAITDPFTEVTVGTELTLGGNAWFDAEPNSVIHMTHDADGTVTALFDNLSTSPSLLSGLANLELSFEGGADLTSTMEIGSEDLGVDELGFVGNFSLGALRVGTTETPADLRLVDDQDNAVPGVDPEALYVRMIAISAGSTLDLNGLNVYYHYLCNEGGTIELHGGVLEQVESAIPGDFDHDGGVSLVDFSAFADCMAAPGTTPDPQSVECAQACLDAFDSDEDADVDLADFAALQQAFTG